MVKFIKTPGRVEFIKTPGRVEFIKTPGRVEFIKTPGRVEFIKTPGRYMVLSLNPAYPAYRADEGLAKGMLDVNNEACYRIMCS
ncbi:hypothetical protein BgiBS90_016878 [Biomphalaria glabrata]|nr:hypothetical protein BgiBS90_016878 [Biomphalaria glabrata]